MPAPCPPRIDLRSDTVTRPTPEMRAAMLTAEVGNSAWGEDPTVIRLEEASAKVVGKEAALFVPSGTMGNEIALKVWASKRLNPEVILEERSHIMLYESGGLASIAGAQPKPVRGVRGAMPPEAVEAAIADPEYLRPQTALISVEETHNMAGGAVVPQANLRAIRRIADAHGLPVHMDGARIFNAAAAKNTSAAKFTRHADSVMFCFSKGLCAPVGSAICGTAAFIEEAVRVRALLGGAMRQAGILAAAALVGLTTMRIRLVEDHANAKRLAKGLAGIDGIRLDPGEVETNIVIFDCSGLGVTAQEFAARMRKHDVGYDIVGPTEVRAVTHHDVTREDLEEVVEATREEFKGRSARRRARGS